MEKINENIMFLYGTGGHARVIMDILKAEGINVEAFIDDNKELKELMGIKILHEITPAMFPIIISIGDNRTRKMISEKVNAEYGIAVHPSAIISDSVAIDKGTVIMQGAIIQACTQIGKHCIINTGASVDHECIIEDFVHISPKATLCGNVIVGEGSWIGAGSVIIPGIKIGRWSIIGAGSVVDKDIPDKTIYLGNRCKFIKSLE